MNKDSGKIIFIGEIESGTSNGTGKSWQKIDVAIEWGDKFKNQLCLTAFNDKVDLVKNLSVGDSVTAEYTTNSRPWTKDGVTKWFHNVNLQSIDLDTDSGNEVFKPQASSFAPDESDLPF